jgi:hypothetical protein
MSKMLGTIKEFDLREIFRDEARDLTPWLAKEENLSVLSEEIGTEIKLLQVEANVGRFNVDILAEEEATGRKIIIENQLGITDHDHLGKLVTYASGHDAGIIIWIFKEIHDEHKKAIEWLNDHTDEHIDFFAIKLQLWQIDNSNPAPKFEIIVRPNEWAKTLRNKSSGEITDTKLQQLEFWTKFKEWVSNKDKKVRLQTPRPQHWYDVSMGTSEAHIALTLNTRDFLIGCEIYINKNKELFSFLQDHRNEIEKKMNMKLEWIEASKACRIKASKADFEIQDASKTEDYFKWLYEEIVQFKQTFYPYFEEFKEEP